MADRLRPLWDFGDLDASERRLRQQLGREPSGAGRAEVLTQLARVEGLRGRFAEGHLLLEEAETVGAGSRVARARIELERGRLFRSSGDVTASLPLFESAFAVALAADERFLAGDAAHMAALAAPNRAGAVAWTRRGVDVAREPPDPADAYWLGPLLNNLGWRHYEAGDYEQALDAFEQALEARKRDPGDGRALALARYALAKTLRRLSRTADATAAAEAAVAWATAAGEPDGWFHEELAESYAAGGRGSEAREHAVRALALLLDADPALEENAERLTRLRRLAGDAG